MKKITKYLCGALAAMTLVGCNDLNTLPMGEKYTEGQREDAINEDPESVEALMVAVYANLYGFEQNISSYLGDFGQPATMLAIDNRSQDMSMDRSYGWFEDSELYTDNTATNQRVTVMWGTFYRTIYSANDMLNAISDDTDDATLLCYKAQALAIRAWAYHNLVQLYATPYNVNPQAAGVPVITNLNQDDAVNNGMPRGTVADVYAQIMSDLNEACDIMGSGVYNGRTDKRFIDPATTYGLRARAYLCQSKYTEAMADAQTALQLADGDNCGVDVVSVPAFNSFSQDDFMWGIHIAEVDAHGLYTFAGMMGSLTYGYAYAGQWRRINGKLWEMIPDNDVRKGWWLGDEANPAWAAAGIDVYESNVNNYTPAGYSSLGSYASYGLDVILGLLECPPYATVKFAPYQDMILNSTGATDVPLMRTEEMELIIAECQAQTDWQGAKTTIEKFVNNYRWLDAANPYVCDATSKEEMLDEVWFQRRIELWGEGFSYMDCLRLQKGIDRRGADYPTEAIFNIAANSPVLLYPIPNAELEGNTAIKSSDQNPSGDAVLLQGEAANVDPYWYKARN
jgi:hypothetical protein